MLLLRSFHLHDVLRQSGFAPEALARLPVAAGPFVWTIVTPVASKTDPLTSSKLFRSVAQQVDDDEKRANFAVLMNGLYRAAQHENYQEVLKGSSITIKVAHEFKYRNKTEKLWELKHGKKDRVYLYPLAVAHGGSRKRALAVLLAHHKKDQTTPREVTTYCESTIRSHIDPQAELGIF